MTSQCVFNVKELPYNASMMSFKGLCC